MKARLNGSDSRFRDDSTYVMFMFLLKEALELKRSRITFFRKARLFYKGNKSYLSEASREQIERENVGYRAFKLMHGTPPYFKAILRQT
jgi:hypothetical protein